jgi:RES domain-containing protein
LYRQAFGPGLDGAGGLYRPGRWHTQGKPVTYFGASPSLVVLERLVHLDPQNLESDLVLGRFEGDLSMQDAGDLSQVFDLLGNEDRTREVGDQFLAAKLACLLRVNSVIVAEEFNYVFNPLHVDAPKIALVHERPFKFDDRLL